MDPRLRCRFHIWHILAREIAFFANKTRVLRRTRSGNCACLRQADLSILRERYPKGTPLYMRMT